MVRFAFPESLLVRVVFNVGKRVGIDVLGSVAALDAAQSDFITGLGEFAVRMCALLEVPA